MYISNRQLTISSALRVIACTRPEWSSYAFTCPTCQDEVSKPADEEIVEPPESIRRYMAEHTPVLSAVGWIGNVLRGADEYGIDMLVELVSRLRRDHSRLGLVLSVNGGETGKVRETVRIREAWGYAQAITTYDPTGAGAEDFRAVAAELLKRHQPKRSR